jgi:cysteine desulfurase
MTNDKPIYLDHNATTYLVPRVVEAMRPYLTETFGNPSSTHPYGEKAKEGLEWARYQIAELIGAEPSEIIFTSGGTEANNLAIRGGLAQKTGQPQVLASEIEHSSVQACLQYLASEGVETSEIEVGSDGKIAVESAARLFSEKTSLISVMHANNETGVSQPVSDVAEIADEYGALVHTDAAQSVGKIPVDVGELGVDLLTVAGHKCYGPKGVGALYIRDGVELSPVLLGSGHERGLRPGTENVPSIVALGEATRLARETLSDEMTRQKKLRNRLIESIRDAIPALRVNGQSAERLPNTASLRFPDINGSELLAATPQIAASTGSACHEGGEPTASAIIRAMGVPEEEAIGTVRLSLGRRTDEESLDQAANALIDSYRQLSG